MSVPGEWVNDALCAQVDPELFYPEIGESGRRAVKLCRKCPVIQECLTYAVTNGIRDGVWGGTGPGERRLVARDRRRAAA